jgi:hypothetical protein
MIGLHPSGYVWKLLVGRCVERVQGRVDVVDRHVALLRTSERATAGQILSFLALKRVEHLFFKDS